MRADRLVSILMLLQARGRMSASQLSAELGVSERTIYRDMDALSAAGIPVYAERGPNGGCCLVEDYRTDLTGLDAEEARALFLVTAPGPLDAVEPGRKLQSALRKLAASLPDYQTSLATAKSLIHMDWTGWNKAYQPSGHLDWLYQAIHDCRRLRLTYRHWWMEVDIELLADPLGLVAKSGEWFLIYRVHHKILWNRLNELTKVEMLPEAFNYPPEFDLAGHWQQICADWERGQKVYRVRCRVSDWAMTELRRRTGVTIYPPDPDSDSDGWSIADLAFSSYEAARQHLIGLGRAVEVLSPEILKIGIIDYARQVLNLYSADQTSR
jgi:predicted DNA-binding transcriptional regulator YafY